VIPATPRILADGHVHLHTAAAIPGLLEAALEVSRVNTAPLLLLLADPTGRDGFRELAASGRLRATGEARSLAFEAARDAAPRGFVVAGRQKVSREGLEVLALALDPADPLNSILDRTLPAEEILNRALAAGAAGVLPWGFGKWTGRRGKLAAELASRTALAAEPLFFLGDVPQRCWPWPTPRAFRAGPRVLAGTDPLPLPGAEATVARYGFTLEGRLDPDRPAASLLALLRQGRPVRAVGRRDGVFATLSQQLRLRLRRP
jgi:hypothetical protein